QLASNTYDPRRSGTPAAPATFRSQSPDVTPIGSAPPIASATPTRPGASAPVTLAAGTQSVYAIAAQRASRESGFQSDVSRTANAPSISGAGVYDAWRGGATLRR